MASNDQTIVLITGANGGIGFELASQLLQDAKYFILLGSRSLSKGEAALKQLLALQLPGTVELLQIDVSSESSILAAAKQVEEKYARLDALVNNAAISGNDPATASLFARLTAAFQTNATGPAIVVETFVPLLDKSNKVVRIVNVTSGAGSISLRLGDPHKHQKMKTLPYRASKAALNMLMACQAYEFGERGWKVFCFCPGFTESGLSPMNKTENGAKPTSEGAAPIVRILGGERDAEHGGYLHRDGQHPW